MSTIDPGEVGGWYGSGGWYRATGESVIAPDGSIAWKYTNPYTWLDGSDRNQGSEVVMWAIQLRTPLTIAPVPRGLYLVQSSFAEPRFPSFITTPTGPGEVIPPTGPTVNPPQVPEPSYGLLTAMILLVIVTVFRKRIRV